MLWPDHCIQDTPGATLIPSLHQDKITHIVQKGSDARFESLSAFGPPFRKPRIGMTPLDEILQENGIRKVFVVGVAFDGCVKSTALDAAELGYETFIVREGVNRSARNEGVRERTLRELEEGGVGIVGLDEFYS